MIIVNPEKVAARLAESVTHLENGCLVWAGKLTASGYAATTTGYRYSWALAHRLAYVLAHGEIPAGMDLDHLCHTRDDSCRGGVTCPHRACINVDHLEPVTRAVNSQRSVPARRGACSNGHDYTAENTRVSNGKRWCRTCSRENSARYQARQRAAA